jgi:hypothetical protein
MSETCACEWERGHFTIGDAVPSLRPCAGHLCYGDWRAEQATKGLLAQLAEAQRERDLLKLAANCERHNLSIAVAALEWYAQGGSFFDSGDRARKALAEIRGERHDTAPAVGADHCGGERCHTATRFCECTCVRCGGGTSTATDERKGGT